VLSQSLLKTRTGTVELKREWREPSNLYGWSAVLRNALPLLALYWLAPVLADGNASVPWLLAPAIGLLVYRLTVVMHDCTHYTLFVGRRLNKAIGSLLGAITGVDFSCFSEQHWRHHRSYGETIDPQGFHYVGLKRMSRAEFRRHLLKPLLGLNLRYTLSESVLAPRNLARLSKTGGLVLVAVVQLGLLVVVTGAGRHPLLAGLPLLSTATFGLFFSQLRGIAEHGVADELTAPRSVRSHAPNLWDRVLLYDVNFNYHREHHEHPQIPSRHLPALQRQSNAPYASESMFHTLRTLQAGLTRSHG
jgi:fatty acid desaturase